MLIDDVAASEACNRIHEPEQFYDDAVLDDLQVGREYQYCISAYSRNQVMWAQDNADISAYESEATCVEHTLAWVSYSHVLIIY